MDQNPYSASFDGQDKASAPRQFSLVRVMVTLAIVCPVVIFFLLPVGRRARGPARSAQCKNNLKQIGLALLNYQDEYGTFPPSYTADADGKPLHSWRTLLLPFLDNVAAYNRIDLTKAWDDPVNQEAFKLVFNPFHCPSLPRDLSYTTYQVIVSEKSCFPPDRSIKTSDIKDGGSTTLMVIEVDHDHAVPWMSPQDADESWVSAIHPKANFSHSGRFHALMADGSVRHISADLPQATLHALMTRTAKDTVPNF